MTQPGDSLGWSVCLSMDLTDEKERTFLLDQMKSRAALTEKETWYLPPEVREGVLLSGVLAKEATVVWKKNSTGLNEEKQPTLPVQSTAVEATSSTEREQEVITSE